MRDNLRFVNQSAVELHKKFAISVACTVFVLVGAPIALRFPRGGVGLVIGVSLVIFGIYYVGLIAGEALLPLPRAGDPDEVAQAYLYLMRGGFTTGQVLVVDGGMALV